MLADGFFELDDGLIKIFMFERLPFK